ncbi:CD276 antigen homolog [Clarias gariepinus]
MDCYEGPGYEGRVDVPEDELHKGNCSLVLRNIRKSDEGIYNSYLLWRQVKRSAPSSWSLIHSVQLSVSASKERSKTPITPTDTARGSGIHLLVMVLSLLFTL